MLLILALAAPIFWYPGCVTAPRLPLTERERPEHEIPPQAWRHSLLQVYHWDAPVVFVGVAEKVRFVGFPVEGFLGYQLVEITARVENVLRGKIQAGRVKCYYYVPRGAFNGQTSEVVQGRRYAYFLRLQQGALRSNADPWITATEIGSGRHAELPVREPVPLERQLEILALTPGDSIDPVRFARAVLDDGLYWGVGRWERVVLLKRLLDSEFPEVRLAACTSLMWRWGQDACWDDLRADETKWWPRSYETETSRRTARFKRQFTANPDTWWQDNAEAHRAAGMEQDLLDELRMLATHKDQRIARAYCPLLNKHYPADSVDGCPAASPRP